MLLLLTSLIESFNKYLLNVSYVPGTVLGAGDKVVSKTHRHPCLCGPVATIHIRRWWLALGCSSRHDEKCLDDGCICRAQSFLWMLPHLAWIKTLSMIIDSLQMSYSIAALSSGCLLLHRENGGFQCKPAQLLSCHLHRAQVDTHPHCLPSQLHARWISVVWPNSLPSFRTQTPSSVLWAFQNSSS